MTTASSEQELRRFAEGLMRFVRDRAIRACDRLASGEMTGPDGERWRSELTGSGERRAVEALIPDIVDQTLFELLNAIDNDDLPLAWELTEGAPAGLAALGSGELGGWLMGSPGWRHAYSSERFFDPLADLRLESGVDPTET